MLIILWKSANTRTGYIKSYMLEDWYKGVYTGMSISQLQ